MSDIIKAPLKGKPLGIPEELLTEVFNAIPESEHNVFKELLLEISRETKQFDENMSRIEKKRKKKEIKNKIESFFSEVESRAGKPNEAFREKIKQVQEKFKEDADETRKKFSDERSKIRKPSANIEDKEVRRKREESYRQKIQAINTKRDSELQELARQRDADVEKLERELTASVESIEIDRALVGKLVNKFFTVKVDKLENLINKIKIERDGESYPNKVFINLDADSLDKYDFTFTNVESVDIPKLKELKKTSEKKAHIQLIIDAAKKKEKIPTKKFVGFGIDSDELIAGFNLTKSNEREAIYKFWKEILKEEQKFINAAETFCQELENLKGIVKSKEITDFMKKYFTEDNKLKTNEIFYLMPFPSQLKRIPEPLGILLNIIAYVEKFYEEVEVSFEEGDSDELQGFISDYAAYVPSDERGGGGGTKASFDVYKPNLLEELNSDSKGELKNIEEDLDTIDPLLLYDMVVNGTIALVKREITEFNEELDEFVDSDSFDYINSVLGEASYKDAVLDDDDFETLQDLVDALEDTFAIEGDAFVLPIFMLYDEKFERAYDRNKKEGEIEFEYTPNVREDDDGNPIGMFSAKGERTPIQLKSASAKNTDNKIQEFLKDVVSLVDIDFQFAIKEGKAARKTLGYQPDRTISSWARDRGRVSIDRLEQSQVSTIRGKKVESSIEKDLKDIMTPFLTAISEYYYKPFFRNRDIGTKPKYLSNNTGRGIVLLANELEVDTILGSSYKKLLRGTQSQRRQLRPDLFKDILAFLNLTRNPSNLEQLIDMGEGAIQGLTKIFPKTEERNRNHIAKIISSLADKMKTKDTVNRKTIKGKTIKERAKEYDKQVSQGLEMPLFALPYWITVNKRSFTTKYHDKVFAKLENFFNRGQNVPLVLTKMLMAHDEIRKMLGKDVVYGFYNLEYNDIDEFILKIHDENKLDLSHMEVTEIVKSYDSHENISKEYGISSDEVYLIKANFR